MSITLHRGVVLAVVLVVAGLAFLSAYRVTSAGCCILGHGDGASGIPYFPNAYQITNNYTYYVTEHTQSIVRWNDKTPRDFLHLWGSSHDIDEMRQYMVYTGSAWDINLGTFFDNLSGEFVPSCQYLADSDTEVEESEAFEWGHTPSNNDAKMTVVCLNVTGLGFPNGFDELTAEERIKAVSQEMGHSLHLEHDSTGVMNDCLCLNITQHEADVINFMYSLPP